MVIARALKRKITIKQPSSGQDSWGQPLTTWTTLVTSLKNTMLPLTTNHQVSVACVRDCPFLDVIQGAFPEAKVSFYDDEYQAMASVVNGDNQYYIQIVQPGGGQLSLHSQVMTSSIRMSNVSAGTSSTI